MASRIEEHGTGGKLEWFGRRQSRPNFDDVQDEFSPMSCEELTAAMSDTVTDLSSRMAENCNAGSCSFHDSEREDIQNLALLAMRFTAIADTSDTKMCLPEVLEAATSFQPSQFTERFLASAVSNAARDRFSLAFSEMSTVQEEI